MDVGSWRNVKDNECAREGFMFDSPVDEPNANSRVGFIWGVADFPFN